MLVLGGQSMVIVTGGRKDAAADLADGCEGEADVAGEMMTPAAAVEDSSLMGIRETAALAEAAGAARMNRSTEVGAKMGGGGA